MVRCRTRFARIVPRRLWHRSRRSTRRESIVRLARTLCLAIGLALADGTGVHAIDWVPTEQEIQTYRQSWNPLSNGPIFISGVDIHPKGQFTIHPFLFSQISEKLFGNDLTVNSQPSPVHTYQLAPVVTMAYGLTNHLELNVGLSGSFWWANSSSQFNQGKGGPWTTNSGLGDTQIYLKYRPIVQDPGVQHDCLADQSLGHGERKSPWGICAVGSLAGFAIRVADMDGRRDVPQESSAFSAQRRRVLLLSLTRE